MLTGVSQSTYQKVFTKLSTTEVLVSWGRQRPRSYRVDALPRSRKKTCRPPCPRWLYQVHTRCKDKTVPSELHRSWLLQRFQLSWGTHINVNQARLQTRWPNCGWHRRSSLRYTADGMLATSWTTRRPGRSCPDNGSADKDKPRNLAAPRQLPDYNEKRAITEAKGLCLQELRCILPADYHSLYDELRHWTTENWIWDKVMAVIVLDIAVIVVLQLEEDGLTQSRQYSS